MTAPNRKPQEYLSLAGFAQRVGLSPGTLASYTRKNLLPEPDVIITDGQGYSATRVEFQVTRWLSLLSSISTLGRQSANVRVSRDY